MRRARLAKQLIGIATCFAMLLSVWPAAFATGIKPTPGFSTCAMAGCGMPCCRYVAAPTEGQPKQAEVCKIEARLVRPQVGGNQLRIALTGPDGRPILGANLRLTVTMVEMDMGATHPPTQETGGGVYQANVDFSMAGKWQVRIDASSPGVGMATKILEVIAGDAAKMDMGAMAGRLGPWSMAREASGTSWIPDSSPMFMDMLPSAGRYDLSVMGAFSLNYTSTNGARGDQRFYSNSMPMLMARRDTGGGTIGMNLMMSLDPIFNGEEGYPDLFQTGETAHGVPLVDHQHPHNLLSEVTASYEHPVGSGVRAFFYGGPIGEPCLGGPAFMHRPSGFEIPEAPISHHWFDSTHISSGVVTLGLNNDRWQLEASSFNGHEPGENRYWPQPISLNSAATRLTYNPSRDLSFNVSYGFLYSPEASDPGVDPHRLTAAAIWSRAMPGRANLSTSLLFGRRIMPGITSDAYLLESTYLTGPTSIFARWENVDEFELYDVPAGEYRVNKVLLGAVQNVAMRRGYELGVGAYAGVYAYPSSLDATYGRSPVTLGVFLRLRPSRMQ